MASAVPGSGHGGGSGGSGPDDHGLAVTDGSTPEGPNDQTPPVLSVSGEIDVATGTKLRAALADRVADPAIRRVVADLTAVTFMSSTGIAVLVDAHSEASRAGKSLVLLTGQNRAVLHPLQISGVDRLLNLDPDD